MIWDLDLGSTHELPSLDTKLRLCKTKINITNTQRRYKFFLIKQRHCFHKNQNKWQCYEQEKNDNIISNYYDMPAK